MNAVEKLIPELPHAGSMFHGVLLHLILIGIPSCFGFLPTGLWKDSLGLTAPCSMFDLADGSQRNCSLLDSFAIREVGYRFVTHYEMAIVACFIIRFVGKDMNREEEFRKMHLTLAMSSIIVLLTIAFIQTKPESVTSAQLEPHLFARIVLYRLIAILTSVRIIMTGPDLLYTPKATWSAPGCALLIGAVINALIIGSSLFGLTEKGINNYFVEDANENLSPVVHSCFRFALVHSAVTAIQLLSYRTFMARDQLQALCGYKTLYHILVPFFWHPEHSGFLKVDAVEVALFRFLLIMSYGYGYFSKGEYEGEVIEKDF